MKNLLVKLYLLLALYCGYVGVGYANYKNFAASGSYKLHIIAPYNILGYYGATSSLSVNFRMVDVGSGFHYELLKGFTYDVATASLVVNVVPPPGLYSDAYDVKINGKSITGMKNIPSTMQTGHDVYVLLKPTGNDITATTISDWSYVPKQ
jgi:hypothetical protein